MNPVPLLVALGAAVAFGAAAVLQRVGATRLIAGPRAGVGLLWRLVHQPLYAVGVLLDSLGFVASLVAVRHAPLYLVQPVLACSVGVTAVLAWKFLDERLRRSQQVALLGLVACVVLLAAGGKASGAPPFDLGVSLVLVAGLPVVLWAAQAIERHGSTPTRAALLGGLSGLAFGLSDVAGRLTPPPNGEATLSALVYVVAVVGWILVGLAIFGAGVRMSAATIVIVGTVVGETVLPAGAGFALGDHLPAGSGLLCLIGAAGALLSAVVIALGQREHPTPESSGTAAHASTA